MKNIVVTAFLLLGIWAAGGETFQIISLEHQIRALADGQVFFDQTSGEPLQFEGQDSGVNLSASTDLRTESGFTVFQTGAELDATQLESPIDRNLQVSASVSMLFKPLSNEAEIRSILFDSGFGSESSAEITNITSGERLYFADASGGAPDGIYPLVAQDDYLLTLNSEALFAGGPADFRFTTGTLFFSVLPADTVIPAPTSLWLSAIGVLTCLLGCRCRTARHG